MIDYLRGIITGIDSTELQENKYLSFNGSYSLNGETTGKYIFADYKGLKFKLFNRTEANPNGRITIAGSLHKYFNDGNHNHNDFGKEELQFVLNDLKEKFNILPKNILLKGIEIGVNFSPPDDTFKILQNALFHKNKTLEWYSVKNNGRYKVASYQNYFIKLYDKQRHSEGKGLKYFNETMRFEVKYSKMGFLNSLGIYTLRDLCDYGLEQFKPILLEHWSKILFYDYPVLDSTHKKNEYSNPNYWLSLSTSNFKYHRKNLFKMIENKPKSIKAKIAEVIRDKINTLFPETIQINPLYIQLKQTGS